MATIREIIVDWTTKAGGGQVSVFWFIAATSASAQRTALNSFLTDADGILCTSTTWSIRTTGREVEHTDGSLVGVWNDSTPHSGAGAQAGEQAADATQILVRWLTDDIVNSRFLRGRTFLPGVASLTANDGNVDAAVVTTVQTAADNLVEDLVQLAVWHRPTPTEPGSPASTDGHIAAVSAASVWNEYAVLRRRRK